MWQSNNRQCNIAISHADADKWIIIIIIIII